MVTTLHTWRSALFIAAGMDQLIQSTSIWKPRFSVKLRFSSPSLATSPSSARRMRNCESHERGRPREYVLD